MMGLGEMYLFQIARETNHGLRAEPIQDLRSEKCLSEIRNGNGTSKPTSLSICKNISPHFQSNHCASCGGRPSTAAGTPTGTAAESGNGTVAGARAPSAQSCGTFIAKWKWNLETYIAEHM